MPQRTITKYKSNKLILPYNLHHGKGKNRKKCVKLPRVLQQSFSRCTSIKAASLDVNQNYKFKDDNAPLHGLIFPDYTLGPKK